MSTKVINFIDIYTVKTIMDTIDRVTINTLRNVFEVAELGSLTDKTVYKGL